MLFTARMQNSSRFGIPVRLSTAGWQYVPGPTSRLNFKPLRSSRNTITASSALSSMNQNSVVPSSSFLVPGRSSPATIRRTGPENSPPASAALAATLVAHGVRFATFFGQKKAARSSSPALLTHSQSPSIIWHDRRALTLCRWYTPTGWPKW